MRFSTFLLWLLGLWLLAGVQAALGSGAPGPVLLLAVAAGLTVGTSAGMGIGALCGLCDAVICSGNPLPYALLGLLVGAAASLLPRWFSRGNVLVGMLAAFLVTLIVSLLLEFTAHYPAKEALMFALRRGGENTLWMFPIYGIVLVMSLRRATVSA